MMGSTTSHIEVPDLGATNPDRRETAWCLGEPECGRRALTDEEHRALCARLAQARSALKAWRIGWVLFWIGAAVLYPFCYDAMAAGSAKKGAVPFLYVLLSSGPAALLMAIAEVITGWSRVSRWIFALLGLGALTIVIAPQPVSFACLLGIYLGGSFVWVIRWQIFRRVRALAPDLDADLRSGVVAEFEINPPMGSVLPVALKRAKVRFGGTPMRFGVLPRTGVLVDVGGTFVDSFLSFDRSWDPLDITQTTKGTEYYAPIEGTPIEIRDSVGQRHATRAELEEIETHRKRLLRRGIAGFFVGTYFAAFCIRFIEALFEGRMKTGVTPVGWIIASAIGVYVAWRSLRPCIALVRASKTARLILVRDDEKAGAPSEVEFLVGTDLLWTIDGAPAPWRTVKW
jgi:hypothetical protein